MYKLQGFSLSLFVCLSFKECGFYFINNIFGERCTIKFYLNVQSS